MKNPSIEELQNPARFELVTSLEHAQIKEFVIEQITTGSRIIRVFMIYQVVMILVGLFFVTFPIVLAIRGNFEPLLYTLGAVVFTFSALIIIHELLHLLALKITGAHRIKIGWYFKKFIFYAEADRHVLNHQQFAFVALTPFFVVKTVTLAGIILTIDQPFFWFWIFVMSAHSLFCAGDIGMLSFFGRYPGSRVFTFDIQEEKRSYYYREK